MYQLAHRVIIILVILMYHQLAPHIITVSSRSRTITTRVVAPWGVLSCYSVIEFQVQSNFDQKVILLHYE